MSSGQHRARLAEGSKSSIRLKIRGNPLASSLILQSILNSTLIAAYKIHTSGSFKDAVERIGGFDFEIRGTIQVKVIRTITIILQNT